MSKKTVVIAGAGQRGAGAYAPYALKHPNEMEIIAVAEPDDARRREFQNTYGLKDEFCFKTWEELFSKERLADAAIICTQDRMHYRPTILALEKGYHVLLEKPMSNDAKECVIMGEYAQKFNRVFSICHVLRYTPFFVTIKEIVESGKIGVPVSIQHIENVDYWHQAHSFVRGNWRRADESSPMILAKSCHDMDIILWLMGADCVSVSSYGSLMHFKKENAPEGAPERCLDNCRHRDECPYHAPKIYIDWQGPIAEILKKIVSVDTSEDSLLEALKFGPYGRCVYHCDNDVVDHQVVNMEFANGATASFTMCAFTDGGGRQLKLMGTKGFIEGDMEKNSIKIKTFLSKNEEIIRVNTCAEGHGGGDYGIMRDFLKVLENGNTSESRTSAQVSVQSHLMALAAEKSRVEKRIINLSDFKKEIMRDL